MRMQNAKCPNCGACLIVDMAASIGHCMYCGGEVIFEEAVEKVRVEGMVGFDSLMLSAQNEMDFGEDYDKAKNYYKQALEQKPNDYRASWGVFLCEMKAIIWHHNRKGFIKVPGDTRECVENVINKYGLRAQRFAPSETQEYYDEVFDYYLSQL